LGAGGPRGGAFRGIPGGAKHSRGTQINSEGGATLKKKRPGGPANGGHFRHNKTPKTFFLRAGFSPKKRNVRGGGGGRRAGAKFAARCAAGKNGGGRGRDTTKQRAQKTIPGRGERGPRGGGDMKNKRGGAHVLRAPTWG